MPDTITPQQRAARGQVRARDGKERRLLSAWAGRQVTHRVMGHRRQGLEDRIMRRGKKSQGEERNSPQEIARDSQLGIRGSGLDPPFDK